MLVDVNHKISTSKEAKISVMDMGFFFGLAIYETLLIEDKVPIFYEEHLARMKKSIHYFKNNLNQNQKEVKDIFGKQSLFKQLPDRIQNLLKKYSQMQAESSSFKLRIMLTPKNYLHKQNESVILFLSQNSVNKEARLFVSNFYKNNKNLNPNYVKTTSNIASVMSSRQAIENNYDESILLDQNYNVTEGSFSNLFFIKEDKVYTPSLKNNLLEGITREHILKILKKNKISCINKKILVHNIYDFDAMFLTSSTRGVLPVIEVGFHPQLYKDNNKMMNKKVIFKKNLLLLKIQYLYNQEKITYIKENTLKWK